jgi:hypothetical protein
MEYPRSLEFTFQVPFFLPITIGARPQLRPEDICWGLDRGWLSQEEAIKFALGVYEQEPRLRPLALSWDEPERIPWILDELKKSAPPDARSEAIWLYVVLAWIRDHKSQIGPEWPLLRDAVISDFGYPEVARPLLSFSISEIGSHPYSDDTLEKVLRQLTQFAASSDLGTLEKLF